MKPITYCKTYGTYAYNAWLSGCHSKKVMRSSDCSLQTKTMKALMSSHSRVPAAQVVEEVLRPISALNVEARMRVVRH